MKEERIDFVECSERVIAEMCRSYHGYRSAGGVFTYSWAVIEDGRPVACFAWKPPPPGGRQVSFPRLPSWSSISLSNGRRSSIGEEASSPEQGASKADEEDD